MDITDNHDGPLCGGRLGGRRSLCGSWACVVARIDPKTSHSMDTSYLDYAVRISSM